MDIWKLITALGGFTVIIASVFAYLGKKLADNIFKRFETHQTKQIELFKNSISRQNSLIKQVASDHSKSFHEFNQKRIEAIDLMWKEILKIKEILEEVLFIDSILTYEELENIYKSDNDKTKTRLRILYNIDLTKVAITNELKEFKPYISNSMWLNYEIYLRTLSRSTFVLMNIPKKYKKWWRGDVMIKQILENHFSKEEVSFFNKQLVGGLNSIAQLVEQKILNEMQSIISGEKAAENALMYIKKLDTVSKEMIKK